MEIQRILVSIVAQVIIEHIIPPIKLATVIMDMNRMAHQMFVKKLIVIIPAILVMEHCLQIAGPVIWLLTGSKMEANAYVN